MQPVALAAQLNGRTGGGLTKPTAILDLPVVDATAFNVNLRIESVKLWRENAHFPAICEGKCFQFSLRPPGRRPHQASGRLFQRFAGALGLGGGRESPLSNSKRAFLFLEFPFWDLSFLALIFSRWGC